MKQADGKSLKVINQLAWRLLKKNWKL